MKIIIDLDEATEVGLAPFSVYRSLYMEYWDKLQRIYHNQLWGMANTCDSAARELYARKTNRRPAVKSLILTYRDAEECFELFKQFADVWALNCVEGK